MGRERGDRATTGWMVVPFDAMGKFVGKRSGVGWGGNDQGFGVYDAFKTSLSADPSFPSRGLES